MQKSKVKKEEPSFTTRFWLGARPYFLMAVGIGMMFLEHYRPFIDLGWVPWILIICGVLDL
jgi:hypothetical protein